MRPVRSIVVVAIGSLVLAACSFGARPGFNDWEPAWSSLTAALPTVDQLNEGGEDLCSDTLVRLREDRTSIVPTPEEALDPPVEAWFSLAEEVFFDCPPDTGFDPAYAELAKFEHEVSAILDDR